MWKIYYCIFAPGGKLEESGVYKKEYKRRGYAERIGRKVYGSIEGKWTGWIISRTNPFKNMSQEDYDCYMQSAREFYKNKN